jgi:hypothetical protein
MRNAMSSFVILKRRLAKFLLNGIASGLVVLAGGVDADDKKQMIVTAFEDATFVPVDPARPDTQMAGLWGDPGKGPSTLLLKSRRAKVVFTFTRRTITLCWFREP